jgi:dienelactone hydrolase
MANAEALKDYTRVDYRFGGKTYPVYKRGSGPAVIIIHEMPGLHPLVIRFADRVAASGMTVYCPSLFGVAGKTVDLPYALTTMIGTICVRREFNVWANYKSSPVVDWLRALARHAHEECGGKGVGVVGMCFTGGFALAMMTEPSVVAPVLSQPSNPIFGKDKKGAIDASPDEIACVKKRLTDEDLTLMGLRFHGDPFIDDERFDMLKRTFGDRFEAIELKPEDARQGTGMAPHSVLTIHLDDEDPDGPTKKAERRVIEFFRERTGA